MWIAETVDDLRQRRHACAGRVAMVPTMGALHAGHLSLIEAGNHVADHTIVSIFVNPTQFGPNEDLDKYPRPREADLACCREAGAAGVFCPSVDEMYPPGTPACEVNVPMVAADLEGARRPGHFAGVCRVVAKLLNMAQPHVACFGEKDFQQLRVIQAMVADLAMPVTILPCRTQRESDGLAMSSRNAYLDPEQRRYAVGMHRALEEARMLVEESQESDPAVVERAMAQVVAAHHIEPDYAVVRHPLTLATLDALTPSLTGGVVALVAGKLGSVRLIDNMTVGRPSHD